MDQDDDDDGGETGEEWRESLDRALQEVEALQAIYGHDEDDTKDVDANDDPSVRLVLKSSPEDFAHARALVETGSHHKKNQQSARITTHDDQIPTLALEIHLHVHNQDIAVNNSSSSNSSISVCLYFGLVPGYPSSQPVSVTILTAQGLSSKTAQEELVRHLQATARDSIGAEAIMELVHVCQEQLVVRIMMAAAEEEVAHHRQIIDERSQKQSAVSSNSTLGRRWIWVHHITDRQRKDDIVREAREHELGGYLKAGYPGVVVVEGRSQACHDFVLWIKGNKSRPGGFGRQWGHHVRGELEIEHRQLPEAFVALDEDLSVLASVCRDRALEDEFKTFVMQHG